MTVLVVAAVVSGGGLLLKKYALPHATAGLFKQEVSVTEVSLISPSQSQVDLTTTGYVVPQHIARVGSKVVGRVTKSNVKEWQEVKEGQILFVLDPTDQKAAIASAQAKVLSARARAQVARAHVAEVRQQFDREKRLAESGSVSKAGADDLQARLAAVSEQARAADAEAAAAQADVNSLKENLKNLIVLSPIAGVASTKPVEVGDVVRPDQILVEISDMKTLMVEADVAEARLSQVKVGAPCEIVLDAYASQRFRGAVVEVSPVLDRAKASAKVKVKFVDDAEVARGQMGVKVSFLAKEQTADEMKETPKKVIPSSAVVDRNGIKVAFVVQGDKVRQTPVTLGAPFGSGFELVDGPDLGGASLSPGTKLVMNPPPTLADGQAVKEASAR